MHVAQEKREDSQSFAMQLVSDEIQLGYALIAIGYAHQMGLKWANNTLLDLTDAGISSMNDLATGCKDQTLNLDLELFCGTPSRLNNTTIENIKAFLPGPVGVRCFRLAQRIAKKVANGNAETEYVHRLENGKSGEEAWLLPVSGNGNDKWVVNVDCAGFVRNSLKHVTKNPFVMALSDRDFMRAKDFYDFFSTIPFSVMDSRNEFPDGARLMKWRIVHDLRMVIPGDVIVYRPKGNAAGGAAFTTNDRKDLVHLLKAVKTAQVWQELRSSGALVTRNVAKDPSVRPWVTAVQTKLHAIDLYTVKDVYENLTTLNDKLQAKGFSPLNSITLRFMKECCENTASNTGHIVFASGPAIHKGDSVYRIRVVHSTKYGKKDEDGHVTTGVQEHYRRFTLTEDANGGKPHWSRDMRKTANPLLQQDDDEDEDDNPNDDMEDSEDDDSMLQGVQEEAELDGVCNEVLVDDELAGQSQVDVIAARMCF
jgi:hypothetical protein